jgi:hypothetical protein
LVNICRKDRCAAGNLRQRHRSGDGGFGKGRIRDGTGSADGDGFGTVIQMGNLHRMGHRHRIAVFADLHILIADGLSVTADAQPAIPMSGGGIAVAAGIG